MMRLPQNIVIHFQKDLFRILTKEERKRGIKGARGRQRTNRREKREENTNESRTRPG